MNPRQKKAILKMLSTAALVKPKKKKPTEAEREWLAEQEARLNRYYQPGAPQAMAIRMMNL